jgi:PKD repeat protein
MKSLNYLKVNPVFSYMLLLSITVATQFGCKPDNPTAASPVPNASFTYSSTRNFPVQVQFVNLSTSPLPGPSTFVWDFGDGTFSTIAGNPIHMYVVAGTYMVKLLQTYADGTRDTLVKSLQLSANGPSGISTGTQGITATNFSFSIPAGYTVTFSNTSTNATVYFWEFGDATTSTSAAPAITHQYTTTGTFTVILKATGDGGTDTCSARIAF